MLCYSVQGETEKQALVESEVGGPSADEKQGGKEVPLSKARKKSDAERERIEHEVKRLETEGRLGAVILRKAEREEAKKALSTKEEQEGELLPRKMTDAEREQVMKGSLVRTNKVPEEEVKEALLAKAGRRAIHFDERVRERLPINISMELSRSAAVCKDAKDNQCRKAFSMREREFLPDTSSRCFAKVPVLQHAKTVSSLYSVEHVA